MEKFQDKYRIPSARLATWDYGGNAAYFITICTAQHTHDFGAIQLGILAYTPLGQCAVECWDAIPDHYPFVILDGFVVMPNHVHGVIVINKPVGNVEAQNFAPLSAQDDLAPHPGTEAQDIASLPPSPNRQTNQFGPQTQNLAAIIRGFKIGVTKYARLNGIPFVWQARYHDHVIRNVGEHERIRQYILNNPQLWESDTYHY